MTLLTGIIYPLALTGIARILFPFQSNGSIIEKDGITVGSELIGQKFTDVKYFHPRPSAIDFDPLPSGGSNLSVTSIVLRESVDVRRNRFVQTESSASPGEVPADMLFASASGLDPDISPESAYFQIYRVAKARHFDSLKIDQLKFLVSKQVMTAEYYLFGPERVNVLKLNLALDRELQ